MSDELIKRSDAINALADYMYEVALLKADGKLKTREHYTGYAEAIIRHIPSADGPSGEWIDDGLDGIGAMGVEYRWHKCSRCGFRISKSPSAYYPNFCEACGARMKGADDE